MEPHSRRFFFENGTFRLPQALICLLRTCLAGQSDRSATQALTDHSLGGFIRISLHRLILFLNPFVDRGDYATTVLVGMVTLTAVCGIGSALWIWSQRNKRGRVAGSVSGSKKSTDSVGVDAASTEPGLFKAFSTTREYKVPSTGFTYPGIRTFYKLHAQEQKLPQKPTPIPLLVFIHGLGGSATQFKNILTSLTNLASCLAIDLPGCGLSTFEPKEWEAYTTEALVQLLAEVIEAHRDVNEGQTVILIGHSMGCSLAAMLASPSSPFAHLISEHVNGLIAICPKADPPTLKQCQGLKKIASMPAWLFDLLRKWDRRGGINSASVRRMTGPDAEEETKKRQLRFNEQSRTEVWQRMARGMCPDYSTGSPRDGLPGREVWQGLQLPIFLAAGEADQVTPVENVRRIVKFLGRDVSAIEPPSEKASLPIAAAPIDPARVDPETAEYGDAIAEKNHQDSGVDAEDLPISDEPTAAASPIQSSNDETQVDTETISSTGESTTIAEAVTASSSSPPNLRHPSPHPRRLVVKTAIMPKPAAHSLLFAPSSSRIISGLIGTFLSDHIDPRLSHSWQLQYLATEGKWDVKNLQKWKNVEPVSHPIAGIFRAMKTLREVDEKHSPKIFVREWSGKIRAVVDISHDSPVYDPEGLVQGGINYYKFPTVSKQPPTMDEVTAFIALIDKIRSEEAIAPNEANGRGKEKVIGVHCHYGFNRTGFFVVSYMIEKLRYTVQDAIQEFQDARPPGIRHDHFIDELHVRYCSGLKKAPTL